MMYGMCANTMRIGLARSGMLNLAIDMIGQGEVDPTTSSAAGTLASLAGPRFAQATGAISLDGTALGNVVDANLSFTNSLDPVEVIRSDGRIGGVDPGVTRSSGEIKVRFDSQTLLNKARNKTPVALTFGWTNGTHTLLFSLPRVYLPKPKREVPGSKGILAVFNWQASGQNAPKLTATLTNDVVSYA